MHMSLCLRGKDVCDACFCACLWIRDRCQHRITRGLALATFFWGPSPLWLSPSLNRPDSWAGVCHKCACLLVCWSACLLLCRYQPAGASRGDCRRHYLGDVHEHQPGGQQVRDSHWGGAVCFLVCSLLILQQHIPHPATSSPPPFAEWAPQTQNLSYEGYAVTCSVHMHMHMFPHGMRSLLISQTLQGRTWCVTKYIGSCRQIALLP